MEDREFKSDDELISKAAADFATIMNEHGYAYILAVHSSDKLEESTKVFVDYGDNVVLAAGLADILKMTIRKNLDDLLSS